MSPAIEVAITSVHGADAPSPGLVVGQMLRRQTGLEARITVLASDPLGDGVHGLPVADRVVIVPSVHRDPRGFVARLRQVARATSRFVLVPGSAADVLRLSGHQGALARAGVRTLLPPPRGLAALPFPVQGTGVRAPRHMVVGDHRPALRARWRYPVAVLRADGVAGSADTRGALRELLERGPADLPVGIHQAVAGAEVRVVALTVGPRVHGLVAARMLHVSDHGTVWSAVTTADEPLVDAARRVFGRLRWRGPAEARFVVDARRRLWFTGLTPGFPSWISLAAAAGQDLVVDYVRLALGDRPPPRRAFADGLLLSRVSVDHATTIGALRRLVTQGELRHVSTHP